jgi:ketosteroid isomerase-like protein
MSARSPAVTAERIALVRAGYEEFAETGQLDPGRYTDDFVWDMSAGWPERTEYRGYAGMLEFLTEWIAAWDDWRFELRELIDTGGDEVVAIVQQSGRAKASGAHVDMLFASVWTIRDGKLARQRMYADPDEALAAAGAERRAEPR